ncbi:MAG: hypothetical protein ACJA2Y_000783 [Cycloclasticus pugetii]|jgi:hypothetical protein
MGSASLISRDLPKTALLAQQNFKTIEHHASAATNFGRRMVDNLRFEVKLSKK